MARNRAANWEKWVQGELVASLQAKGKIPKTHTVASEYKDKAYQNTAERIFPVSADEAQNMTAVLLAEAREKLTTAQAKQHHTDLLQKQQAQLRLFGAGAQQGSSSGSNGKQQQSSPGSKHRDEIKARICSLKNELVQESRTCVNLQAALAAGKSSER